MRLKLTDAEAVELAFCLRAIRHKTHKETQTAPVHLLDAKIKRLGRIETLLERIEEIRARERSQAIGRP